MTKQDVVYQDLKSKIISGTYVPWGSLENEGVLCERYGVSRPTLQKAVSRLKQEGLVHSRQGAGVFVNPPEFFSQYSMKSFTERYKDKMVTSKVLQFEIVPAGDLDSVFHRGGDELLIHYRRQRFVNGEPAIIDNAYLPLCMFRDFDRSCLTGSVLSYFENDCGYMVSHSLKTIRPIIADARAAELLGVEEGAPLLEQDETVYLARNVVLQYSEEISTDPEVRVLTVR